MPAIDTMASTAAAAQKETTKSVGVLEELIKTLSVSKSQDEANATASNIATLLNGPIEERTVPAK
jgi:elongation factor 3